MLVSKLLPVLHTVLVVHLNLIPLSRIELKVVAILQFWVRAIVSITFVDLVEPPDDFFHPLLFGEEASKEGPYLAKESWRFLSGSPDSINNRQAAELSFERI